MAATGRLGITSRESPNLSPDLLQIDPPAIPFDIRQEAIKIAVAQINIETMNNLAKRLVTQLQSPEKETCFLTPQILSLLQWKLKHNQNLLKQMSGKNELEWLTEELAIKDGVDHLQKTSPEMFIASRLPSDEQSLSMEQLTAFHAEILQGIHESFSKT